jgi:hypothetical protein
MSKLTQAEFYKLAARLRKENPGMADEELGARLLNEAFGMTDEELAAPPTAEELAAMPGPQSIDDALRVRLELAERIGELTRNGRPTGTGRLKTVARPIGKGQAISSEERPAMSLMIDNEVRPIGLDFVIDGVASLLDGDCRRAAELVERAFANGFDRTAGWTEPLLTEEERHSMTLLTTEPTSVDDRGVRKARQRAVKWFQKRGRVIEERG